MRLIRGAEIGKSGSKKYGGAKSKFVGTFLPGEESNTSSGTLTEERGQPNCKCMNAGITATPMPLLSIVRRTYHFPDIIGKSGALQVTQLTSQSTHSRRLSFAPCLLTSPPQCPLHRLRIVIPGPPPCFTILYMEVIMRKELSLLCRNDSGSRVLPSEVPSLSFGSSSKILPPLTLTTMPCHAQVRRHVSRDERRSIRWLRWIAILLFAVDYTGE